MFGFHRCLFKLQKSKIAFIGTLVLRSSKFHKKNNTQGGDINIVKQCISNNLT